MTGLTRSDIVIYCVSMIICRFRSIFLLPAAQNAMIWVYFLRMEEIISKMARYHYKP